jgi:hypothetical protein
MRTIFPKNHQNSAGSARIELKNHHFFEFKFENFEKIKKSGKIMLNNRSNSKNIGGDFFSNLDRFVG